MAVNWRLLFLKPCQLCDQLFQGFLVLTFSEYPPNLICVGIDPVCTLYSAVRHHLVGKHQLKDQLINNSRFVRIFIISWWWNIRKLIFVLCSPLIVNSLFTQHIARKRIFALAWKKQYVRRIGGLLTQSQKTQSLEFQTYFLQGGCTGNYLKGWLPCLLCRPCLSCLSWKCDREILIMIVESGHNRKMWSKFWNCLTNLINLFLI